MSTTTTLRRIPLLFVAGLVWVMLLLPSQTAEPARIAGVQRGLASYYGPGFNGRETASGTIFDQTAMTAAHRTLPLGTVVRVTNLENGRAVTLKVTDRGPYGRNYRRGTIIDVSKGAARRLRFVRDGLVRVKVEVVRPAGAEVSAGN